MYYQIILKVPKRKVKIIEDYLYFHISQGWETIEEGSYCLFNIFLEDKSPEIALIEKFLAKHLDVEVDFKILEEKNWEELWKANFKPLKVGKKLVIIPPWEKYKANENEVVIIIEPAQAFGTGHHPTTQMMLENIEIFLEKTEQKSLKILDLGCGTGILGIACAKLFKNCKIWAIDIDEEALKACNLNTRLNRVRSKIYIRKELPKRNFDLILANIGYRELKKLSDKIKALSQKRTHLFLSGILTEDAEKIVKIYQEKGFSLLKHQKENEWSFLWFIFSENQ